MKADDAALDNNSFCPGFARGVLGTAGSHFDEWKVPFCIIVHILFHFHTLSFSYVSECQIAARELLTMTWLRPFFLKNVSL